MADGAPLNIVIGARSYALDTLVLRQPGDGKLPVAVITHGASPGNPRGATIGWLRGWAADMARRGWLAVAVMRRGYGGSDGDVQENAGTCQSPDVGTYLDTQANDVRAAVAAIAERPDADMSRLLLIGNSAGGAVVLDAAASVHAAAVVNVSGGLSPLQPFARDPACGLYAADLVWNFARFGHAARMPTLWLYAENDGLFAPSLVARMRNAFAGAGGTAELHMLPPFRADGHAMFFADGGQAQLLPLLDQFLRDHSLPTWDEQRLAAVLQPLSDRDRDGVREYTAQPAEAALAVGPQGGLYWHWGGRSAAEAAKDALDDCRKQTGADCRLAMSNFDPVP